MTFPWDSYFNYYYSTAYKNNKFAIQSSLISVLPNLCVLFLLRLEEFKPSYPLTPTIQNSQTKRNTGKQETNMNPLCGFVRCFESFPCLSHSGTTKRWWGIGGIFSSVLVTSKSLSLWQREAKQCGGRLIYLSACMCSSPLHLPVFRPLTVCESTCRRATNAHTASNIPFWSTLCFYSRTFGTWTQGSCTSSCPFNIV